MAEAAAMESNQLLGATERALNAADAVLRQARSHVLEIVAPGGPLDAALIDREQMVVHGFAWMATYVEALRQIRGWASRLDASGEFGEA
jgi:(2S)-methylsuccinyl-CoA dehydrogenase